MDQLGDSRCSHKDFVNSKGAQGGIGIEEHFEKSS